MQFIEDSAFYDIPRTRKINSLDTIEDIESYSFNDCSNLAKIFLKSLKLMEIMYVHAVLICRVEHLYLKGLLINAKLAIP